MKKEHNANPERILFSDSATPGEYTLSVYGAEVTPAEEPGDPEPLCMLALELYGPESDDYLSQDHVEVFEYKGHFEIGTKFNAHRGTERDLFDVLGLEDENYPDFLRAWVDGLNESVQRAFSHAKHEEIYGCAISFKVRRPEQK